MDVTEASLIDPLLASAKPDVLIDFTAPAASVSHVRAAAKSRTAVIVGTTGISPEQRAEMAKAIEGAIPAVISSNFSIGVNIFWNLLREAARMLPEYDVEVLEAHHRYKKDAPSGTAKTILQILDEELRFPGEDVRTGRHDGTRQRDRGPCHPGRGYCRGPLGPLLREF